MKDFRNLLVWIIVAFVGRFFNKIWKKFVFEKRWKKAGKGLKTKVTVRIKILKSIKVYYNMLFYQILKTNMLLFFLFLVKIMIIPLFEYGAMIFIKIDLYMIYQ